MIIEILLIVLLTKVDHREITSRWGKALSSFYLIGTFCWSFLALWHCKCAYIYSVDLSLFVLLYNTNFMNKIKFNACLKIKNKKWYIDCTNFPQSTKSPHFPLREMVSQLSKRKRLTRVLCWYIYFISVWRRLLLAGVWKLLVHWKRPTFFGRSVEAAGAVEGVHCQADLPQYHPLPPRLHLPQVQPFTRNIVSTDKLFKGSVSQDYRWLFIPAKVLILTPRSPWLLISWCHLHSGVWTRTKKK